MIMICKGATIAALGVCYFIALSACMPQYRDDGMGDLWKGVKHVENNRR